MLAYYRNNLTHVFINEAEIACSLLGFSIQNNGTGYTLDDVWKRTQFLKGLLNEEFVLRDTMKTIEDFKNVTNFMSQRKFLKLEGDKIIVDMKEEAQQLGQSFLYNLLLPFIETYWITIAYFAVEQNRKQAHDEDNLYQKIQWFLETFY